MGCFCSAQTASYDAQRQARYSPHYDNNPWEKHNRREITLLLYLNVGWDPVEQGGHLRVHPPDGSPPVDIAPVAGRLAIFHAAKTKHEVLLCLRGERVAVTLWVEYEGD